MEISYNLIKDLRKQLYNILADHTGQEAEFQTKMRNRTTIVRATSLTDDKATGKLVEFGDTQKCPTSKTDRADLDAWIDQSICGDQKGNPARVVNLTGVKQWRSKRNGE